MNIRFVRKGHQSKTILGEMQDAYSGDLPEVNDKIVFDGIEQRVLSIVKSYEWSIGKTQLICWFEVDIT
ncbi:hypothetical protein vBKpnMJEC_0223 [Klebsiella phage vB_KpnM-JEC]|nr:hypothetical protein vBKpnMJEC_0223 [Klebsiella phage vB_KpnM-JEC]